MAYLISLNGHSGHNIISLPKGISYLTKSENGYGLSEDKVSQPSLIGTFDHTLTGLVFEPCPEHFICLNQNLLNKAATLQSGDIVDLFDSQFRVAMTLEGIVETGENQMILFESDRFSVCEKNSPYSQKSSQTPIFDHVHLINELNEQLLMSSDLAQFKLHLCNWFIRNFKDKRLFLFLWNETTGSFKQEIGDQFVASKTVLTSALTDKIAILSQDIVKDTRFNQTQSIVGQEVRSILCIPIIWQDKVLGLMYSDVLLPGTEWKPEEFEFLCLAAKQISFALVKLKHVEHIQKENLRLKRTMETLHPIVGESKAMIDVMHRIHKVAPTDLTVLIRGETGTGKELAAQKIHDESKYSDKPFVIINCAGLSESLLESELFGHEKGSFTDAKERKTGKLEYKDGATIFLDEIGEISPRIQAKLLRFLQNKTFERVGGNTPIKVNVRFLAATNRDLEKEVKQGTFREDLYYRLKGCQVTLPPLRDRIDDIPLLATYFMHQFCLHSQFPEYVFSEKALEKLKTIPWHGNVRELKHCIEQAIVFSERTDRLLTDTDFQFETEPGMKEMTSVSFTLCYKDALNEFEKNYLAAILKLTEGNVSKAAELSQLERSHLYLKLKKYSLNPGMFRT